MMSPKREYGEYDGTIITTDGKNELRVEGRVELPKSGEWVKVYDWGKLKEVKIGKIIEESEGGARLEITRIRNYKPKHKRKEQYVDLARPVYGNYRDEDKDWYQAKTLRTQ